MTDHLQAFLDAAYAVRWALVAIAFLVMGAVIALLVGDRTFFEEQNAELAEQNEDLRAELEAIKNGRPRIVRLPARREVSR